ncbi:MAG: hypothetical protein J0L93_08845 [Deltaproteobacteria bacterium]|nr:hypothetical protein [Deltaproteobacteria bacterium]
MLVFLMGCAAAPIFKSYQTPEDTFKTWRQAVERLDLQAVTECYAVGAQPGLRKEIVTTSKEGLEAMQRETRDTTFEIQKIIFEDRRAYLRVERKRKGTTEIEVVNMVKESNGWKLLP